MGLVGGVEPADEFDECDCECVIIPCICICDDCLVCFFFCFLFEGGFEELGGLFLEFYDFLFVDLVE